ncbi:hypothetical protein AB6V29_01520 [Microbacterium sp. 20-116]|uniref:hypothetical protein n=1 Tax=Microbacterium sp. 20-116 TaxID=3239883 RepID=UPI0034E1EB24
MTDSDREIHLFMGTAPDLMDYTFPKDSLAWVAIKRQIDNAIDQGRGVIAIPLGKEKGSANYVYSPNLTIRWVERPVAS